MDLVAENDILKLYADPKTGYVAIYDKRNQQTVYSNPLEADEDAVANNTNKNYLKSQFILDYYNAARTAGSYDSYSMSVAKDQLEVESIDNGIRFIYTLGEEASIYYYVPYYISNEWAKKVSEQIGRAHV